MISLFSLLILFLSATAHAQSGPCPGGAPLAFEGAEGAGRCAQGGRGGVVIDVTNLNDSGAGSLRDCLQEQSGARTCRAMVAGWVSGQGEDIIIRNPHVTFDGSLYQLGVKDGGVMVRADDTIIRHLRIRPGLYQLETRVPAQNANGIFYMSTEVGGATSDHYCDHCSVSWGSDDLMGVIFGATNVTIDHSIIAEGLECAQCGGKGLGMGGTGMKVSVLRSLFANTWIRWPEITSGDADFVNTIAYNDNGIPAQINPIYGTLHINFVGNTFKWGPNIFNTNYQPIRTEGGIAFSATSEIFVDDNYGHYSTGGPLEEGIATPDSAIIWGNNGGITVRGSRYSTGLPEATTLSSSAAYTDVLANAGAQPRDAVDTRIIAEVTNNTGVWKTSVADAGGWPVLTQAGTTPPPAPPGARYMLMVLSVAVPGSKIIANFVAPPERSARDWMTLAPKGSAPDFYMDGWAYVPPGTSGTVEFTAPSTPGSYEVRYLLNDGFQRGATAPVEVTQSPPPPSPPQPENMFYDCQNSGKVMTCKYLQAKCPGGIAKSTSPNATERTWTMTCKP